MMPDFLYQFTLHHGLTAAGIVVVSLLIGLILDRVVLAALKRAAARTSWEGDDLLIRVLRGVAIFWSLLAGFYAASQILPMPPAYLGTARKLFVVIFLISATFVGARIITGLLNLYVGKNEAYAQSASILTNILRITIFVVGALIILQYLGISITPILTALGVGGLAVALALQGPLSNLFSGMQIIASRKVKPGDYIQMEGGEEGYVTDINWQNTTIRQISNNVVIVPNAKMASAVIVDYHQPDEELSVLVQVGVSYRSDLERVEAITIEVARDVMKNVPGGIPEFQPLIRFHTFGESSIQFSVILRGKEFSDQYLIKHEFIKRLVERYTNEGIAIPFPMRTVELRQIGSSQPPAIPPR
ncbi:MAG: mechanosensitive ion channel family protein [bacterium]|nr:mechanosensitive ion channel family protein [bacterium]